MRTEVKMKYCKVCFDEDYSDVTREHSLWVTVDFEWGDKAPPLALAFSHSMDHVIRDKARLELAPLLNIPAKGIELEDCWLMVAGYKEDAKHHAVRLIGIVAEAEREFDKMIKVSE